MRKFPINMKINVGYYSSLISEKKERKQGHRLLIAACMDALPHGSSNLGPRSFSEKFFRFFHNFQTLPNPR